ncbi:MFS general substrate transporter [Roridomyces roridus]|uniref:MFS general substrate transporter n=1 Tax=Roridomyces roridus TaxID=1738132 RepID=A0AAD7C2A2_9AGAR|nr:MFS general substrate transporter [Roridomyces roridus]
MADPTNRDVDTPSRPNPLWMMILAPLSTLTLTLTAASTVQLYAELVCRVDGPKTLVFASAPTQCASATSAFIAVLTSATGITTFLTVAWWGSFSDRHGRTRVLAVTAFGHLLSTLNNIFVAKFVERIPGGYWFLLLNSVVMGLVGGEIASESAALFAYMGDLSTPETRSRLFSLASGFAVVGVAVGPLLGSFIVRFSNNVLWVFYVAAMLRLIQMCIFAFVLPESLTRAEMDAAMARMREESLQSEERTILSRLRRAFFFLQPLAVLWPEKISKDSANGVAKRDWNLLILTVGNGLMLLASSSLTSQFLYALSTFRWDAEYLGYCISSLGASRGIFLILILPVVIKYFKDTRTADTSETEPLLAEEDAQRPLPAHSSLFDLALARVSILIDMVTFAILPFAPTGSVFTLFIMLGSFGYGLQAAVNSVALALYAAKVGPGKPLETGKLFGAMSVLQAVFANVLGPFMYGAVYAKTVATFPTALFFVALGNTVVAFVLFAFVRLPPARRIELE